MAKLSDVLFSQSLPRNMQGRDFVVGDLHGHRLLLEQALERVGFDVRRDRLLSVGDLIDRGPDSLGTLGLLQEPWFHAVLGNHELMLLNYLGRYRSRVHSCRGFLARGGGWIEAALLRERKALLRVAERVAALPLVLRVLDDQPFAVAHGDLLPLLHRREDLLNGSASAGTRESIHVADQATRSRVNLQDAKQHTLVPLRFADTPVLVSDQPMGPLPLAYVGHAPLRHVTVHNSHVYIDQGAGTAANTPERPAPTLLAHRPFAHWLRGVAAARTAAQQPLLARAA